MTQPVIFFTKISSPEEKIAAKLLIESLRTFGGALSDCPLWIFNSDPEKNPLDDLAAANVQVLPLAVPDVLRRYPFGSMVSACARAEQLAPAGTTALVWLDPTLLVFQPPLLFDLGSDFDAALRPVHIRNVGLPPGEPLDAFWGGIYAALGVTDVSLTVTSFIDRQVLRAYFNSHALAVRPSLGLFRRWLDLFEMLLGDQAFQAAACGDDLHRIFLFQALFSTLVAATLDPRRVRILPESYNYPYHLHQRAAAAQRVKALNDLVIFCNDDLPPHPDTVTDAEIREPLRSWLAERLASA
jgi:hypothetical protein